MKSLRSIFVLERDSGVATKEPASSTDLLHRRVFLPFSSRFVLRESIVCVKSDFPLLSEALCRLNLPSDLSDRAVDADWEIAVETQREGENALRLGTDIEPIEVHRFGPSNALRMNCGSWFAHTPPSLNGVGFAMVAGDERDQIHQLCVYLGGIMDLLEHSQARSISELTPEVTA
jgi:hypothetical protein